MTDATAKRKLRTCSNVMLYAPISSKLYSGAYMMTNVPLSTKNLEIDKPETTSLSHRSLAKNTDTHKQAKSRSFKINQQIDTKATEPSAISKTVGMNLTLASLFESRQMSSRRDLSVKHGVEGSSRAECGYKTIVTDRSCRVADDDNDDGICVKTDRHRVTGSTGGGVPSVITYGFYRHDITNGRIKLEYSAAGQHASFKNTVSPQKILKNGYFLPTENSQSSAKLAEMKKTTEQYKILPCSPSILRHNPPQNRKIKLNIQMPDMKQNRVEIIEEIGCDINVRANQAQAEKDQIKLLNMENVTKSKFLALKALHTTSDIMVNLSEVYRLSENDIITTNQYLVKVGQLLATLMESGMPVRNQLKDVFLDKKGKAWPLDHFKQSSLLKELIASNPEEASKSKIGTSRLSFALRSLIRQKTELLQKSQTFSENVKDDNESQNANILTSQITINQEPMKSVRSLRKLNSIRLAPIDTKHSIQENTENHSPLNFSRLFGKILTKNLMEKLDDRNCADEIIRGTRFTQINQDLLHMFVSFSKNMTDWLRDVGKHNQQNQITMVGHLLDSIKEKAISINPDQNFMQIKKSFNVLSESLVTSFIHQKEKGFTKKTAVGALKDFEKMSGIKISLNDQVYWNNLRASEMLGMACSKMNEFDKAPQNQPKVIERKRKQKHPKNKPTSLVMTNKTIDYLP